MNQKSVLRMPGLRMPGLRMQCLHTLCLRTLCAVMLITCILMGQLSSVFAKSAAAETLSKPELDSKVISVSVDGIAHSAESAPVRIRAADIFSLEAYVQNTGTATWGEVRSEGERGGTFLSRGPDYNQTFGTHFIIHGQGARTLPNETYRLNTLLRAPTEPGEYTMIWQSADWLSASGEDYRTKPFFGEAITVRFIVEPRTDQEPEKPPRVPGVIDGFDFEYEGSFALPEAHPRQENSFYESGITLRTVNLDERRQLSARRH